MSTHQELSLDPADWDAFRILGHRMMDDMVDRLQMLRDTPVWQPVPASVKQNFTQSLPRTSTAESAVYDEFLEMIAAYPLGNQHPRFWGWVMGGGTGLSMLAELLTGATDVQMGGGEHAGPYVEKQVIDWFRELFAYPQGSSGVLVSGASISNLVALTVARNTKAGYDVRAQGLQNASGYQERRAPMVLYASSEVHSSHQKNVEVLGLGTDAMRMIPVDEHMRMDVTALRAAIIADVEAGNRPFCVIATSGTTRTGAFDDLAVIADLCAEFDLWLHVDGAFGAMVAFTDEPELRQMIAGIERSDSLTFDMHKWMCLPFEAAGVLVRDRDAHFRTFAQEPDYLHHAERGAAGSSLWFSDYEIQLTRSFRALKVWMSMKAHGSERYGKVIAMNIAEARYLASLVDASPELERTAETPSCIVCFRYVPDGAGEAELNAINEEILYRLQESGIALVSNSTINGKYSLRMANVNHRSTFADFEMLVEAVTRIGREVVDGAD